MQDIHRRTAKDGEYYVDKLTKQLKELERKVPRDIEWRVVGLREDVENYLDPYHDSGDLMVAYNDLYEALMGSGAMEGLERDMDEIGDLVDAVHFGDFGKTGSTRNRCASCGRTMEKQARKTPRDLKGEWIGNFYITDAGDDYMYFQDNRAELFWGPDIGPEDFNEDKAERASDAFLDMLEDADEKIQVGGTTAHIHPSYDIGGPVFFLDDYAYTVSFTVDFRDTPDLSKPESRDKLGDALLEVAGRVDRAMMEVAQRLEKAYLGGERRPIEVRDSRL